MNLPIDNDPLIAERLTKSGKVRCLEIRRPESHGMRYRSVVSLSHSLADEFDGAEDGEEITITYREMDHDEFLQLPEFEGW